jgi:hypothetical protein
VSHRKVTFPNRYGITLAADLYEPEGAEKKLAAITVCGPFGAVKEQAAGLYAQAMAERGFLTIAFDPSFTDESGGTPRYMASPDINTEDFQAAVDFLSVQENVDPERIGIIGICGWGGLALNVAALDTRIRATVASTMYDMSRVNANGYFDADNSADARYAKKESMNAQRLVDYKNGGYALGGGVVDPLPEDAPFFVTTSRIAMFLFAIRFGNRNVLSSLFLFRNRGNIIPLRMILFRKWSIMFWKARCTLYVYDSKTGRREMGNFR